MRTLLLALSTILVSINIYSQNILKGTISDGGGDALPFAYVILDGDQSTETDEYGKFSFEDVSEGKHSLDISYLFNEKTVEVTVDGDTYVEVTLITEHSYDEIIVRGTRAQERTPMTYSEISSETIEQRNVAVDAPYVMKWTPSAVVTSDAGGGVGYTGIRIRGSDPTRINVTINGVPYNDAESQGSFWVDIPDILGSAEDIQIQRGVGTSSQGPAAFGATINVNTLKPKREPFGRIDAAYGSFNTRNIRLRLGTGMINDKFYLEGRLSHIDSDGYIDRATSNLNSYYISAGYQGNATSVKLVHFTGEERTYQSWFGLPAQYQGIDSLRTYNEAGQEKSGKPYENQIDSYLQSHTQLHLTHAFDKDWTANLSLHNTNGRGYYEEYEADEEFSDYKMKPIYMSSDTINSTDLIRRRWLDNHFYGAIVSLQYNPSEIFDLIIGGGWNNYLGDHFGEVIWARFASDTEKPHEYYFNDAIKNDYNIYAKSLFTISPGLTAFVDLQFRRVVYQYRGFDRDGNAINHTVRLPFFNPKIGLTYIGFENQKIYASAAIAHREPNRDDYTESPVNSLPEPEKMLDIEAGYEISHNYGHAGINAYGMFYRNQLLLTGRLNDVGAYPRINVDNSYRIGLELSSTTEIIEDFYLLIGGTISRNKIKNFNYYVDNWDTGEQELHELNNTDISFSPELIGQAGLSYRYNISNHEMYDNTSSSNQYLDISLLTKYVGQQYLDNTSNAESSLSAYSYSDLQLIYNLPLNSLNRMQFNLKISNLFNQKYISNGWIYRFKTANERVLSDPYRVSEGGNTYSERGFFPQAGIHYNMSISLLF